MEKDFWLERWEKEETGFHQGEINPYLRQYWEELHHPDGGEIFVPLCGKSLDMLWLRSQGYDVLGVELSSVAVQAFFKENGYVPKLGKHPRFDCYEADRMRILCGDFFDLTREDLADVHTVYDRASLIALPPAMRKSYAQHLVSILPPATQILLVTVDYPQAEMQGPPFAVSAAEVAELYRDYAEIRLIKQADVLADHPRFVARGINRLHENIFILTIN